MELPKRLARTHEHRPRHATATLGYKKLFELVVEHEYYNKSSDQRCPDFELFPNGRAELLMRTLGLLFRPDGSGFSVFYNADRLTNLARYLHDTTLTVDGETAPEPWTYLAFFVVPRNPWLASVTDIPFEQSALDWNYYYRNDVVDVPGDAGGSGAPPARVLRAQGPYPVKPARFPVWYKKGGHPIVHTALWEVALDVTGDGGTNAQSGSARSTSVSGAVPGQAGGSAPPSPKDGSPPSYFAPPFFDTDRKHIVGAYVDISAQYEGRYILEGASFTLEEALGGTPSRPQKKADPKKAPKKQADPKKQAGPQNFIYTIASPVPLGFMHLILTKPKPSMDGLYPVALKAGAHGVPTAEVTACRFLLRFGARATRWVYFIVPRAAGAVFSGLVIENAATAAPGYTFRGPSDVTLPNGAAAYCFVSDEAIKLQQRSPVKLRLRGKPQGMDARTLVERLPVASAEQLLRRSSDPSADPSAEAAASSPDEPPFSHIYVYV